ncbi:MAG: LexA family transcriptional regulator [Bdellovibrionota bacterium]
MARPRSSKAPAKRAGVVKRSVDEAFLKAFGDYCRKLRIQLGYSVDRLSRESENLSSSVIQRLETGSGPVNLSSLRRYSQVLGISLSDLFAFDSHGEEQQKNFTLPLLSARELKGAAGPFVPVYSLKAAAGYFGKGEEVEAKGWASPQIKGLLRPQGLFIVQALGTSMQPLIKNGDYLLMRASPTGSRQGKVVLAQYVGPADPESGGSFTVKIYDSKKIVAKNGHWAHGEITLKPLNPDFEPIVFTKDNIEGVSIVAECVGVIQSDLSVRRI